MWSLSILWTAREVWEGNLPFYNQPISVSSSSLSEPLCYLPPSVVAQMVKNLPTVQETQVRSLGLEDPLQKGTATQLQYSCWENSMDRGAWWATVYGVTDSRT